MSEVVQIIPNPHPRQKKKRINDYFSLLLGSCIFLCFWRDMSHNSLTGPVPDFSTLPNLKFLWVYIAALHRTCCPEEWLCSFGFYYLGSALDCSDLSGNNLMGSVPQNLLERSINGTGLDLRFDFCVTVLNLQITHEAKQNLITSMLLPSIFPWTSCGTDWQIIQTFACLLVTRIKRKSQ